MTAYPPALLAAAAQAAHQALGEADDGWHYTCAHPEPGESKECWKGDRAAEMLVEDVIPAVLDVLVAAGWRPAGLADLAEAEARGYGEGYRDGFHDAEVTK